MVIFTLLCNALLPTSFSLYLPTAILPEQAFPLAGKIASAGRIRRRSLAVQIFFQIAVKILMRTQGIQKQGLAAYFVCEQYQLAG